MTPLSFSFFVGLSSFLLGIAAFVGGYLIYQKREKERQLKTQNKQTLAQALRKFFGSDPNELPVVSREFAGVELPNLHLALEHFTKQPGVESDLIGYINRANSSLGHDDFGFLGRNVVGPVQHIDVDVDVDKQLQCVVNSFYLVNTHEGKLAVHVYVTDCNDLVVEVRSKSHERGAQLLQNLRDRIDEVNIFRGKMISLSGSSTYHGASCSYVRFHERSPISADEIILPNNLKSVLERNCLRFFDQAEALRESGHSVKRGILLHGKPGTGKTLTTRWIANALNDVTVILMTGEQLGMVQECCNLARVLAPSLVIMEDVDLIAQNRSSRRGGHFPVALNQLLNEMDGISSESEVIFFLTTNRPEVLEPALAERPGRVDQAIEYPLPDADCRRRLIELYSRQMKLQIEDLTGLLNRTENASPAFIKELVRKSAFIAAEENSRDENQLIVHDEHFDSALTELIEAGGQLTRSMLGFREKVEAGVN